MSRHRFISEINSEIEQWGSNSVKTNKNSFCSINERIDRINLKRQKARGVPNHRSHFTVVFDHNRYFFSVSFVWVNASHATIIPTYIQYLPIFNRFYDCSGYCWSIRALSPFLLHSCNEHAWCHGR